jgi:flagellar biosynthesis anti-sigma factor FlgM
MRIDLNAGAAASGSQTEKIASSRSAPSSTGQTDQSKSLEGKISVGKLETAALNSPEVRFEKVQALRSQLQSGTYQVSPTQVAGSMLEQLRVRGS